MYIHAHTRARTHTHTHTHCHCYIYSTAPTKPLPMWFSRWGYGSAADTRRVVEAMRAARMPHDAQVCVILLTYAHVC